MPAQLQRIAGELKKYSRRAEFNRVLWEGLAATPVAPANAVRTRILAIPVKGLKPYNQVPGLRKRIANCVIAWADVWEGSVYVGIAIDSSRMPPGQYSLPLGMEGVKPWRHPVFGDDPWVDQGNAPHPYFYEAASVLSVRAKRAINKVLDQITTAVGGN